MTKISNKAFSALGVSCMFLIGCSTNVHVQTDFPAALTPEIPLVAGLYFDKNFRDFTYSNTRKVTISLGEAEAEMFSTVFGDLFQKTHILDTFPQELPEVDLIISPHIEEVQLSLPSDTQIKVFELWIKYNVQVFDGNGVPVADWIMTSYGRAVDRTFSSDEGLLEQAVIMALRDTGAQLVTQFALVRDINLWLEQRLALPASPGPAVR